MTKYNRCISSAAELVTSREQTRAGFVEAALEKSHRAAPYVKEAQTLHTLASAAENPMALLGMENIRPSLLTAAGLSDKALNYFTEDDKTKAIEDMIKGCLEPAGEKFVDELVYRFLLTRGETLGGTMRNLVSAIAETKLKRELLSVLSVQKIAYSLLFKKDKPQNKWEQPSYDDAYSLAQDICAFSWGKEKESKVLFFNTTIPAVKKNVDICLYNGTPAAFDGGQLANKADKAVMFGELKGGIDPAGADEHWKTGNSALKRIRDVFGKDIIKTSFLGAAIESAMAEEIFAQLEDGTLSNAANITCHEQLTKYCQWLVTLR